MIAAEPRGFSILNCDSPGLVRLLLTPRSVPNTVSAMTDDFFDPTPEEQNVVLVNSATLRQAEELIEFCEYCNPDGAEIPFDMILDRVTGIRS
jgi:hypothetical protein